MNTRTHTHSLTHSLKTSLLTYLSHVNHYNSIVTFQSQTKIMIRGKGATKEGKLGRAGLPQPGEDEPLHALITGSTPESVKAAVDKVSLGSMK